MTGEPEPLVSVVVPSVSGTAAVFECLAALFDQEGDVPVEVVVVDRCGETTRQAIRARFPGVRLLAAEPSSPLPAMRGRGLAAARGRMIAVLGEHLRPGRVWLRTIGAAHQDGREVVGGPIESGALRRSAEWAFFLSEYAAFLPPVRPDRSGPIAGSNCAYTRVALDRVGARTGGDVWDSELAECLRAAGARFASDPGLSVRAEKRLGVAHLLVQRHHCSRSFGARRSRGWPVWKRMAFVAATPLVAPLVLARIVRAVASRRRHRSALLRALPLLAVTSLVWAMSEAAGVLCGAGPSPGRLE